MSYRRIASRFMARQFQNSMDDESDVLAKNIIALGCMTGSAVASPILFEFRNIWFPDIVVFFVSSAAFLLQNHAEIKEYGPFTLAIATLLGLAAYSSARTPLRDMVSWIPLFICLLVLLTVFFLPRLYQTLQGADPNISMEEGHAGFILDHFGEPMETTSRRGSHRGGRLRETHFRELDISNMGRPTSRLSNALSIHESDIDLQDSAEIMRIALRRMVGPIRNNHFEETSSGASLDGSRRSDFAAHQSSTHTSQDRNYSTRSSSPESSGSPSPSSANSEADELLQG